VETLIIGDVHGCATELATLVDRAHADRIVLVGDLFTKGPDPAGVMHLIRQHGMASVLGNHDERLLAHREGRRPGDAHAARVCAALDAAWPDWEGWLRGLPLCLQEGRYRVVHAGLHPSGDPERTTRRGFLYRRRWPDDREDQPLWWTVYEGPPVCFGHDARRGLVRRDRDGRPWIVGLDTGCVYGGRLTGWCTGSERILQVEASRPYAPVGSSA
jgi:hypothetical protein